MTMYPEYRKALIELLNSIKAEIGLDEEDAVLILYKLDSVEKISMFNRWIGSKLRDGKLQATETEICRAAVQIAKQF